MQTAPARIYNERCTLQYYLHQAGRRAHNGVKPIYSVPHFVQRGHGIGSYLSGMFQLVRLLLWSGVKAVGRETLRTGGKILSDIADNTSSDVQPRHIIMKYFSDSAQNLIQKLRGNGHKRPAALKLRGIPLRRRRSGPRLQKETSPHKAYLFISDHSCET